MSGRKASKPALIHLNYLHYVSEDEERGESINSPALPILHHCEVPILSQRHKYALQHAGEA